MPSVAIADDSHIMRSHLGLLLSKIPGYSLVSESKNGYQLLVYIQKVKSLPDFIIFDLNMPIMDGVAVANFIHYHYPTIKLLAISFYNSFSIAKSIIDAGVNGFLLKSNLSNLDFAIQSIVGGKIFLDNEIKDHSLLTAYLENKQNNSISGLSSKEIQFLQLLVADITFDQIASVMNVATSTLANYQKSLKEKTGIVSRNALTVYAIQHGIAKVADLHAEVPNPDTEGPTSNYTCPRMVATEWNQTSSTHPENT